MSNVPSGYEYTADHMWLRTDGDACVVGITHSLVEQMGDITSGSLSPVGSLVMAGEPFGEVESGSRTIDLYSLMDGEVVAVNDLADEDPALVNAEPFGLGWLLRIRKDGGASSAGLLNADEYMKLVGWSQCR